MSDIAPNDHFDGKRFCNSNGSCRKGLGALLKWAFTGKRAKWPKFVPNSLESHQLPNRRPGEIALTFIGHASFLLQVGEANILLDPVLSLRVSPVQWAGPKRVRSPGIKLEHLPTIQLLLESHNHYDHLDIPTLRFLAGHGRPHVVTPLGNRKLIATAGLTDITELDWWQSEVFRGLRITVTPAQHFSARKFSDRNKALWGGFVIEAEGKTIFFAGDSGYAGHFKEIARRFPNIDVALLPIGAYEPRWFMKEYHMNPAEAVQVFQELNVKRAIGMHFGTFQLTDEGFNDPVETLSRETKAQGLSSEQFGTLATGETVLL